MPRPLTRLAYSPVDTSAAITHVANLAQLIWRQHYIPIIGQAQVAYMLEHLQNAAAIGAQIASGHEYFLVSDVAQTNGHSEYLGYFAVLPQPATQRLFISKFYLLLASRAQGVGRAMLEYITVLARQRNVFTLWLTVNKFNPALQIYLHWGFGNMGAVVKDIGGGFVMDDYQLEKNI